MHAVVEGRRSIGIVCDNNIISFVHYYEFNIAYIFSAMKETWGEAEFVLQPPLSQKEIHCAEQVARDLELLVEKVSHVDNGIM